MAQRRSGGTRRARVQPVVGVPVRVVGREHEHLVAPSCSITVSRAAGSAGPSTGCSVTRTCSRTYSDGARVFHGTSRRRPRHTLSKRQERGQPGEARPRQHDAQAGEAVERPLGDQRGELRLERRRHVDVLLDVVRRPARRGRRQAGRAAEVQGERQVVLRGRLQQRPPDAVAVRDRGADRQVDLHEARVRCRPGRSPPPPSPAAPGRRSRPRRRGSGSSHSATSQSLTALAIAAAASGLRIDSTP